MIHHRLKKLQNPANCSNAKKIVSKLSESRYGFACELHHAVFCLIMAYGTNRTLIYKTDGFNYRQDKSDLSKDVKNTGWLQGNIFATQ